MSSKFQIFQIFVPSRRARLFRFHGAIVYACCSIRLVSKASCNVDCSRFVYWCLRVDVAINVKSRRGVWNNTKFKKYRCENLSFVDMCHQYLNCRDICLMSTFPDIKFPH